ncbi:uncharacterized protein [Lolium perenne]|uniref:uncharacterized protein n=1 Tax=Lolium perenne TaxID=4522 RepID=UPI003A994552
MSVLGLNCRGLGGAAAVRDLRLLAERYTPAILFVVETQLQRDRVEGLARSLGFDNSFAVSSSGRSGGIGIFWNNSIKFEVLPYSQYHLDGVVIEEGKDPWRLTVVYGEAQGVPWTFEKKVAGGDYCRVRLDRALASSTWCALFPEAEVHHLPSYATSDHLPILLECTPRQVQKQSGKLFRYEVMWESHEGFPEHLADSWNASEKSRNVADLKSKLQSVSHNLSTWGRETFGSVRLQIRTLQRDLAILRSQPGRVGPSMEEKETVAKLEEVLQREEIMWRQRSRIQWLAEGDKNTRFFHLRASQRKKKNRIAALARADGTPTSNEKEMGALANGFYKQLYTSEGVSSMEEVLNYVPTRVDREMNRALDASFQAKEVKEALFEMYPTKAPGPDGFPAHFFSAKLGCVRRGSDIGCDASPDWQ